MKESSLERQAREYCKRLGIFFLKLSGPYRGFPDRTVIGRGCCCFVEFKTPKGRVSRHQQIWLGILRGCGFRAEVVRSIQEFKDLMEEVFGETP